MGEKVIGEDSEKVVITHSIGPECKARIEKEIQDLRISGEDPEDE